MAMYIKLSIGDEDVVVFGVQRQEDLTEENNQYTYHAQKYENEGHGNFRGTNQFKVIKHIYSDKAEILAEKVLHAFNFTPPQEH